MRMIRSALLCLTLLVIALPPVCAEEASSSNQAGLLMRLLSATDEQREALGRYMGERYPALAADILEFITKEAPESVVALQPDIDELIAEQYEGLEEYVSQQLLSHPQVGAVVRDVIAESYPNLPAELRDLPDGAERVAAAHTLITTRYPRLLSDITAALKQRYPGALNDLQQRLLAKFPRLLADSTALILRRYPGLTLKLIAFLRQRYPELLPALVRILATPPAPPAVAAPPSDPPEAAPAAPDPPTDSESRPAPDPDT